MDQRSIGERPDFRVREIPIRGQNGRFSSQDIISVIPTRYWRKQNKKTGFDSGAYFNIGFVIGEAFEDELEPQFVSSLIKSNQCGLFQYGVQSVLDASYILSKNTRFELPIWNFKGRSYCKIENCNYDFVESAERISDYLKYAGRETKEELAAMIRFEETGEFNLGKHENLAEVPKSLKEKYLLEHNGPLLVR